MRRIVLLLAMVAVACTVSSFDLEQKYLYAEKVEIRSSSLKSIVKEVINEVANDTMNWKGCYVVVSMCNGVDRYLDWESKGYRMIKVSNNLRYTDSLTSYYADVDSFVVMFRGKDEFVRQFIEPKGEYMNFELDKTKHRTENISWLSTYRYFAEDQTFGKQRFYEKSWRDERNYTHKVCRASIDIFFRIRFL